MHQPIDRSDNSGPTCAGRTAFTLLELMLVLSILAIMGAIMAPQLTLWYERQRLSAAAYEIKLQWEEARLEAMRSGQAQVFTCLPETGQYSVQPLIRASDVSEAGQGAKIVTQGGTVVETQSSGMVIPAASNFRNDTVGDGGGQQELEDGITFVSCVVSSTMRDYLVTQDAQTAGLSGVSTLSVGQQVLFYPDGSTSTAEVRLQNRRGEQYAVRMRGLTGHVYTARLQVVAPNSQ